MDMTNLSTKPDADRPAQILVVEDESVVALDIQEKLEQLGYTVLESAITGPEAVQKAEELLPDLVLMDIRLRGEMDGITAAQHIRDRTATPVVFLTAYGDSETLERVKKTDPFGYLLKPFEAKDLQMVVEVALYRHKTERDLKATHDELKAAHDRLQMRAERAAATAELGLSVLEGATFSELAQSATTYLTRLLDVDFALLLACSPDGTMVVQEAQGLPPSVMAGTEIVGTLTPFRDALLQRDPVRLEALEGDPPICFPSAPGVEIRGGLCMQVDGYREPWGVVAVLSPQPAAFSETEAYFLQSVAHILSTAIKGRQIEDLLLELSTPILPLDQGLLLVPLVGSMDSRRVAHLNRALLESIRSKRARVVVLDLTGLGEIEGPIVDELLRVIEAVALLGARMIVSGISRSLSESMVALNFPVQRLKTVGDLRLAIEEAELLLSSSRR